MNAEQTKDKIIKIRDEEIEALETSRPKEIKIDGDFFENATLGLYYEVLSTFIEKITTTTDNPETFIFIDNCFEKEGVVRYNDLDLITSSPHLHRISATEFPKLHGKVFIEKLFITLLKKHPYSVLFSKVKSKVGYNHELCFHLMSNQESLKTFREFIDQKDILDIEHQAETTIIRLYEADQKDTSCKKYVKSIIERIKI